MLKITVHNETEEDRREIYRFLNNKAANGNFYFEEISQNTMTFLSECHTILCLCCRDILYFEYLNRKIRIVTKSREYICINERMCDIAEKMKPHGFAMCHQSFVVNLFEIERIGTQELIMKNGDTVFLAQKRASAIRKELRSQSGKILI